MAKSNVLEIYREKRNFKKTIEPHGKKIKSSTLLTFVVQKHDATALHYDFRLEVAGVLKSWAVPKGPPLSTNQRRLAIQTEDHPLEYANFEGSIPEGEYGAGTVEIWDTGTYRNLKFREGKEIPPAQAIEEGHITFSLDGQRLKGGYALTRTGFGKGKGWILVKMKDE